MYFIDNDKIYDLFYEVSKKFIIPNFKNLKSNQINYKNNTEIVTLIDIEVETYLQKKLINFINNSYFVGEEIYTNNKNIIDFYKQKQYCWTVDPIDGTSNYVKGKENFAIMIALTYSSTIIQSWIYKPITEQFFYSKLDEGAYLNSKKIKIKKSNSMTEAIGSISTKYWDINLDNKIKILKNNFKQIDHYGSIGCEYIDIVLGKRDFTILSKLSPWDHLPGVLMVREAGGYDSHFDGYRYLFNQISKNLIVSSSKNLNNEIINKIKEIK